MADMRKVEEGSAFPEKCKPNSINKTLEGNVEVNEEVNSNSNKKQKLDITPENEKGIIGDKVVELKDGKENSKSDETNDKDEVEPEIYYREGRIPWASKGKWKLVESEEETEEESSDDSDSQFSDGLDTHSEDDII